MTDLNKFQNEDDSISNSTSLITTLVDVSNSTNDTSFLNVGYLTRILPSVIAMSILFVLSAVGNITVFTTLVGSRLRKTRISTIILHLTISDLIVTFLVIPSEVRLWSPCFEIKTRRRLSYTKYWASEHFLTKNWVVYARLRLRSTKYW